MQFLYIGVGPRWNIIHWMVETPEGGARLLHEKLDIWEAVKRTGDYHIELGKNVNKSKWHEIFERVCKYCHGQGWAIDWKLDNASYHKDPLPDEITKKIPNARPENGRVWAR